MELATGSKASFLGKPNPLNDAQRHEETGLHREQTVIIVDHMDTDILAGIESEIDTALVLTGVTAIADLPKYPNRPRHVLSGIAALLEG